MITDLSNMLIKIQLAIMLAEVHSEHNGTSNMEFFAKIVND